MYPFINSHNHKKKKQNKAQWLTELLAFCESLSQSQERNLNSNQRHAMKAYLYLFCVFLVQFLNYFLKILVLLVRLFEIMS